MNKTGKFDKVYLGAVAGFLVPILVSIIAWGFISGENTLGEQIRRIINADIVTHIISLCVFPNIFLFLLLMRLNLLRATRGVLGITIFWAALVFAIKFIL